jgi:hypothetical protein
MPSGGKNQNAQKKYQKILEFQKTYITIETYEYYELQK